MEREVSPLSAQAGYNSSGEGEHSICAIDWPFADEQAKLVLGETILWSFSTSNSWSGSWLATWLKEQDAEVLHRTLEIKAELAPVLYSWTAMWSRADNHQGSSRA